MRIASPLPVRSPGIPRRAEPLRPFITIIQHAGSALRCKRTASRRRRFMRFRIDGFTQGFGDCEADFRVRFPGSGALEAERREIRAGKAEPSS